MKMILTTLFFAASALAQNTARTASACGPENGRFNVRLNESSSSPTAPEPGKATVYFIQDNGTRSYGIGFHIVARIGVDGSWVGAVKGNAYLPVFLEPGEHHVCVDLGSHSLGSPVEFAHFTAEAGKVYYFRSRYVSDGFLLLAPPDSDEATHQIATFPLSVSEPKR